MLRSGFRRAFLSDKTERRCENPLLANQQPRHEIFTLFMPDISIWGIKLIYLLKVNEEAGNPFVILSFCSKFFKPEIPLEMAHNYLLTIILFIKGSAGESIFTMYKLNGL